MCLFLGLVVRTVSSDSSSDIYLSLFRHRTNLEFLFCFNVLALRGEHKEPLDQKLTENIWSDICFSLFEVPQTSWSAFGDRPKELDLSIDESNVYLEETSNYNRTGNVFKVTSKPGLQTP